MKKLLIIVLGLLIVGLLGAVDVNPFISLNKHSPRYLNESFEGSFPPEGWANPKQWDNLDNQSYEGSKSAHKYANQGQYYILSTPKLRIIEGDQLSFWRLCGNTSGTLVLMISEDRANWCEIAPFDFTEKNIWYSSSVNLSYWKGSDYYIGFRVGPFGTNYYVDSVIGPELAPIAPGPATLVSPNNGVTKVSEYPLFNWDAPSTEGIASAYKLYVDTVNPPQNLVYDGSNLSYSIETALEYDTEYYWAVEAYNDYGSSPLSDVRSFRVRENPVKPLPYFQDFNGGTSLYPIEWEGTMMISGNHGTNNTNRLCVNLSRTKTNAYACTPSIGPLTDNALISLEYRMINLVQYPGVPFDLGISDKLEIQVAFNNGGFETIYTIDRSNHHPVTAYATVCIPISGHGGEQFRIKLLATWGNGDYYIDIDNVAINPVFDFPADETVEVPNTLGDSFSITMSGGAANQAINEVIPDINNSSFSLSGKTVLDLIGTGPWTITIGTSASWGAYFRDGNWHGVANTDGQIVMPISAVRAGLILPIVLGDSDLSLAVELSAFSASINSRHQAVLSWVSEAESDLLGYYLLRNINNDLASAQEISELVPATNTSVQQIYVYTDKEHHAAGTYYYWLQACNMNGSVSFYGPIYLVYELPESGSQVVPLLTGLQALYPNPFNPDLFVNYSLADADEIELTVYNARGQLLRTLDQGTKNPGQYRLVWDGCDERGQSQSSGVYFIRLQTRKKLFIDKAVLLK